MSTMLKEGKAKMMAAMRRAGGGGGDDGGDAQGGGGSPAEVPVAAAETPPAPPSDHPEEDALGGDDDRDFADLRYLATKRQVRVTIRKSTQAGMAAGLSVMAGTLVAGPVGSVAGGALGTALAVKISKDAVPLNELLEGTPPEERKEVIRAFNEAFKEEFVDTIRESPELKLILAGRSPLGVVRYMVERDLIQSDKLDKVDGILEKAGTMEGIIKKVAKVV